MNQSNRSPGTRLIERGFFYLTILMALIAVGVRVPLLQAKTDQTLINVALLKAVMSAASGIQSTGIEHRPIPDDEPVTGVQARALALLAAVDGDTAAVEKWLAQGLTDGPSVDLTQFEMCRLYWNAGHQDLALNACRGTTASAKYWLNMGYFMLAQRQADEAMPYFLMAGYVDPGMTAAWKHLGFGLHAAGEYKQAVLALERVLVLDPLPTADVYHTLGAAYLKLNNPAMARDILNQAMMTYSDQRVFYLMMAETYRQQDNLSVADSWLARLLQRWPSDAQAWAMRADIAQKEDRWEDAVAYLQEATHYQPTGVGYLMNLAAAAAANGDVAQATEVYRRVIELRPDDAAIWLQVGRFLVLTGQASEARQVYERVLVLQPTNDEAAMQLAALKGN